MARVILINGYPESGKDKFTELCSETGNVLNLLTSTPAKEALATLGWDGEKTAEARNLLAKMMKFSYGYNGPLNYVLDEISKSNADIIFVHIREPKNLDLFKKAIPDALSILILRESQRAIYSNDSDNDVEKYTYDVVVDNNRTVKDLKAYADSFVRMLMKGWL